MTSSKKIRIAINGFGRIGRCIVRAISEHPAGDRFELVAINDLATASAFYAAYAWEF